MAIKSKFLNKFYIQQYIINGYNSFEEWSMSPSINLEKALKREAIVGFFFTEQDGVQFSEPALVLNLYWIKREYYRGPEISVKTLREAWELFLFNCEQEEHSKHRLFQNPPIELWLDTKDNWCKKLARTLAEQFDKSFQEALSNVYLVIMQSYRRNTVYMGNLGYIRKAAYNRMLMDLRYNKCRINQDSGNAISLDTVVYSEGEDELSLLDMLPSDEETDDELMYKEILEKAKELLSKTFSPREIDQILTQPQVKYLPLGLYRKLMRWRNAHNVGELYE
jgi:hypothetical protein